MIRIYHRLHGHHNFPIQLREFALTHAGRGFRLVAILFRSKTFITCRVNQWFNLCDLECNFLETLLILLIFQSGCVPGDRIL